MANFPVYVGEPLFTNGAEFKVGPYTSGWYDAITNRVGRGTKTNFSDGRDVDDAKRTRLWNGRAGTSGGH